MKRITCLSSILVLVLGCAANTDPDGRFAGHPIVEAGRVLAEAGVPARAGVSLAEVSERYRLADVEPAAVPPGAPIIAARDPGEIDALLGALEPAPENAAPSLDEAVPHAGPVPPKKCSQSWTVGLLMYLNLDGMIQRSGAPGAYKVTSASDWSYLSGLTLAFSWKQQNASTFNGGSYADFYASGTLDGYLLVGNLIKLYSLPYSKSLRCYANP